MTSIDALSGLWSFIPKEVTEHEPPFRNIWADGPDRLYLTPTTLRSDPSSDTQEKETTISSYGVTSTFGSLLMELLAI
jgi:hypothetical protein